MNGDERFLSDKQVQNQHFPGGEAGLCLFIPGESAG
jgi:hypothetical protein